MGGLGSTGPLPPRNVMMIYSFLRKSGVHKGEYIPKVIHSRCLKYSRFCRCKYFRQGRPPRNCPHRHLLEGGGKIDDQRK